MIAQIRATCYLDHIWLSLVPAQNVLTRSISFSQRPENLVLGAGDCITCVWQQQPTMAYWPVWIPGKLDDFPKPPAKTMLVWWQACSASEIATFWQAAWRMIIRYKKTRIQTGPNTVLDNGGKHHHTLYPNSKLNRAPAFLMESWTLGTS